jgi:hypothetical protein
MNSMPNRPGARVFLTILLVVLFLLGAGLAYISASNIGFPDGFKSDSDRAWKKVLQGFVGPSLAFALFASYLAAKNVKRNVNRQVSILAIAYALLGALTYLYGSMR